MAPQPHLFPRCNLLCSFVCTLSPHNFLFSASSTIPIQVMNTWNPYYPYLLFLVLAYSRWYTLPTHPTPSFCMLLAMIVGVKEQHFYLSNFPIDYCGKTLIVAGPLKGDYVRKCWYHLKCWVKMNEVNQSRPSKTMWMGIVNLQMLPW